MAAAFLSLLSVVVSLGHGLLGVTRSVTHGVEFRSYLLGAMLRLEA